MSYSDTCAIAKLLLEEKRRNSRLHAELYEVKENPDVRILNAAIMDYMASVGRITALMDALKITTDDTATFFHFAEENCRYVRAYQVNKKSEGS